MTTLHMTDLVRHVEPDGRMISTSNPEPALRAYNVVARYRSEDAARNAVLALESLDADDGAVGVTVVELPSVDLATPPGGADQSAVAEQHRGPIEELTPRTLKGAAIGLVVGAVLVGSVTALIDSSIWIGAAIGGAIFGLVVGAIWGAFLRMGGSDAYRQTFVETSSPTLTIVSLHSDDRAEADEARRRLALQADTAPLLVEQTDDTLSITPAR
jgi:hypothetical protein